MPTKRATTKSNSKETSVSFETDLQKVKDYIESGKLEAVISKLDPSNVNKSLDIIPIEIIRILTVLFQSERNEEQAKILKPEDRKPLEELISVADKHKGREFVKHLISTLSDEPSIFERLNFPIDKFPVSPGEGKVANTITEIVCMPLMMLKTSRLYAEIGFFQGEELLFRSTMELDKILGISSDLLSSAKAILDYTSENARSTEPKINIKQCEIHIKALKEKMRLVSSNMANFTKPKKPSVKRKQKRSKSK